MGLNNAKRYKSDTRRKRCRSRRGIIINNNMNDDDANQLPDNSRK